MAPESSPATTLPTRAPSSTRLRPAPFVLAPGCAARLDYRQPVARAPLSAGARFPRARAGGSTFVSWFFPLLRSCVILDRPLLAGIAPARDGRSVGRALPKAERQDGHGTAWKISQRKSRTSARADARLQFLARFSTYRRAGQILTGQSFDFLFRRL